MNGFNKNVSDRSFTDTSKIVSSDNITAKWLKTIISSILLGEKTFYTAFCLITKLFIMSTDQHQLVWGLTWYKKKDMWLSSQLKECIMWLKIVQFARIRKIVACPIKNDWIYNSNNNCVLMAIKKDYLPKKMAQKV